MKVTKIFVEYAFAFCIASEVATDLKRGRTTEKDDLHSGRPKSAIPEIEIKILDIVLKNKRVKIAGKAKTAGISTAKFCGLLIIKVFECEYQKCFTENRKDFRGN